MKYADKLILAKNDEYRVEKEQGRGGSTLKLGGVGTGRIPLTRYRHWGKGKGLQIKGTGFCKCLR